jgi:peptide/nickel transport system substrate-binding protein
VTVDDVKFSFERYKGGGATTLKARVAAVEIVDPHRVRFRLKQPWPDFMTFYATPATSAAWVVPKRYLERVGDDGFCGPRLAEVPTITGHPFVSPYEDLRLK